MTSKQKMWFAYPKIYWNTQKEKELIMRIKEKFPDYNIETANSSYHEKKFIEWKKGVGNGQRYYFEEVIPRMDAGIFLSFEDGMFGAGAFDEAKCIHNQGKPIYEITLEGIITRLRLDPKRRLSIHETIKRYKISKTVENFSRQCYFI